MAARLTLQAAARRSWATRFSIACPLSVALGLQSHPYRSANCSFPGIPAVWRRRRHPPELRRCSVVQRTRNLVITIVRLAGQPALPPPCATAPADPAALMDDHEVLTDFAGALLLHGLLIFAIGFGLAPGNWLALVTATCSLAAGVRCLAELAQLRDQRTTVRPGGKADRGRRHTRRLQA